MRISKHEIIQDKLHSILACFRCYAIEDHATNNCHKEKKIKICSECILVGHTWNDCSEDTKRCINCKGEHGTMTMRCPKRKEMIQEKKKGRKCRNNNHIHQCHQEEYWRRGNCTSSTRPDNPFYPHQNIHMYAAHPFLEYSLSRQLWRGIKHNP